MNYNEEFISILHTLFIKPLQTKFAAFILPQLTVFTFGNMHWCLGIPWGFDLHFTMVDRPWWRSNDVPMQWIVEGICLRFYECAMHRWVTIWPYAWTQYTNLLKHHHQTWQRCWPWQEDEAYWIRGSVVEIHTIRKSRNNLVDITGENSLCIL